MSNYDPILWAVLIIALVISIRIASKREKKLAVEKSLFMAKFAFKEQGYVYSKIHKYGLSLINKASGHYGDYNTTNVLNKTTEDAEVFVFDFEYASKSGRSTEGSGISITRSILIEPKDKVLFDFEIYPENMLEKLKQLFGAEDIDFEAHPEFSSEYVLKGPNPEQVKQHIPSTLIKALEKRSGLCIESRQNGLLVYNIEQGQSADYEQLYKDAMEIYDCLK